MSERVEWGNEYYAYQPGNFHAPLSEKEARYLAKQWPEYRRLVKRTVIESDWEEAE